MGDIATRRGKQALGVTDYSFREAFREDLPSVASFNRTHDFGLKHAAWLEWKYFSNPQGQGRLFLLEDHDGQIAGTYAYIPQVLTADGQESIFTMQAVDLFFAPAARGKGLYPPIQDFGMRLFTCPLIAFPNKRSEKITLDSGWDIHAPIETWAYPLSMKADAAVSVLNPLLQLYQLCWYPFRSTSITLNEVDRFEANPQQNDRIPWSFKRAEVLNWRFARNPMIRFRLFEFLENGTHIGYCVLRAEKGKFLIYDFYVSRRFRRCLGKIIAFCRREKADKLIMKGINLSLWRYGFLKLPVSTNMLTYRLPPKRLTLTMGDSDW